MEDNKKAANIAKKRGQIKAVKAQKKASEKEFIAKLQEQYEQINIDDVKTFSELPLSPPTQKGLKKCGYVQMTEIQKETIKLSLEGKDILGAAHTGSGKTLAFLIPILEKLYCLQWTRLDGIGAIVITPVRELALQIFETLRNIGEHHDFSAGLVIGGKDLKFERKLMDQCNIIICTPGRLLQHMDENPLFDCTNMKILVLDEADRCLDLGFKKTMNAIIDNLPLNRQTLLFSATQTKSVKDLVRLSLKDPCYVSVHEHAKHSTPDELIQRYVVCELKDKLTVIWSFIRNHIKKKTIIFFATCKEVKYFYEMFSKLRPGVSLMALYGTLHQLRRMAIYEDFSRKSAAVLFATDVAARGLDFPAVNWVVQADCPEDVATYIHRVGRTARYHQNGESLLVVLPSEVSFIDELKENKIPIEEIEINIEKLHNPLSKMTCYLDPGKALYDTAERAFGSYLKSVLLMKNKKVFNIEALDFESYGLSLGLKTIPKLPFLERMKNKINTNPFNNNFNNKKIIFSDNEEDIDDNKDKNTTEEKNRDDDEVNEIPISDDILNYINYVPENDQIKDRKNKILTKAQAAKKYLKKQILPNKKVVFNDEGEEVKTGIKEKISELAKDYENEEEGGIDIEKAKIILKEEDKNDMKIFREKIKAKHKEKKRKLKEKLQKEKAADDDDDDDDEFDEVESDNEPDLSWLPDPDKIYGKNEDIDEDQDKDDKKEKPIDNKIKKLKGKKRKLNNDDGGVPVKKKKNKKEKLQELGTSLDVAETEELAMMFLQNRKL